MILEQQCVTDGECSSGMCNGLACAMGLQMDDLGSIPIVHDVSTSLAVVSLTGKFFFQHKQNLPPLHVATVD